MKKTNRILSIILSLFLVSLLVFAGYISIYNPTNLDLRNWASGSKLETRLVNSSVKVKPDQAFTVDFEVNTKGKQYSGIQMSGTISGVDQEKSNLIVAQPSGLNPIFTNMEKDGDNLTFNFIHFSSTVTPFNSIDSFTKLATLSLYPNEDSEITITLDGNQSGGVEYEQDFNQTSINKVSYKIELDDNIGGSSAPPDQGIHRGCNEYCADSRECQSQFSCYYNRCRNPKNLTGDDCSDPIIVSNPASIAPAPTPQTQTNNKGSAASPSPSSTPLSTIATVIITSASQSTPLTPSYSISNTKVATASPIVKTSTTSTTRTVRKLNSNQDNVTEQQTPPQQKNNLLPILIGATVLVGFGVIMVIVWLIRNIQKK